MLDPSFSPDTGAPIPAGHTIWHLTWQWLERHQRRVLIVALIVQLGVLVSMIVLHCLPLYYDVRIGVAATVNTFGNSSYLSTIGLQYDFNTPPKGAIEGVPLTFRDRPYDAGRWLAGRPVYVTLEPDASGGMYHAVRWSVERPESGVYLRGQTDSNFSWQPRVYFGVETYSASSSEWGALSAAPASATRVELAVAPWGQAKIVSVK